MIIKKNRNIFIYISLCLLFLPFILLIVQMVRYHNRSEYPTEISNICFEGQYSYDEKNWIQIPEDNNIPESKNRKLYLRGHVGEEIVKGSRSQSLPSMFRSSGSVWQRAVSPGITKEENVRIQLRFPYDNSQKKTDTFLNGLYMGDGGGLYRRMFEHFDWLALAALIEVIAGWLRWLICLEFGFFRLRLHCWYVII